MLGRLAGQYTLHRRSGQDLKDQKCECDDGEQHVLAKGGNWKELDEDRSVIAIVAVPRVRLEAAIPAAVDQMTMGSEETLRLKAPRVVKALENPREKAGVLPGGKRCKSSSCPRN